MYKIVNNIVVGDVVVLGKESGTIDSVSWTVR